MKNLTSNQKPLPLPGDYRKLIKDISALGYEFPRFLDFDSSKTHVLLRHDVDISISHAHKLAKIENELGIHSAYFILVRSNFYNPYSRINVEMLREIIDLGHDIGLHIDLSVYECSFDNVHAHVVTEARMLSDMIKAPVYLVSFHRPTATMRNVGYEHIKLPGFVNLYEPSLFKDIGFISDSRGGWYHGHPLCHPSVRKKKAFQLLTHPIWWVDAKHRNAVDALNHFSHLQAEACMARFREEFSILQQKK